MSSKPESKRTRILKAAEQLFADHGYESVGMRRIASSAGVSLALLTYHFGTKEQLYRTVFEARVPVLEERLRLLREADLTAADAVEQIVTAFVDPQMELRRSPDGLAFANLLAREATDPTSHGRGIIAQLYDPLAEEFIAALHRARPELSADLVRWKYLFAVGAISMSTDTDRAHRLGADPDLSLEAQAKMLKDFLVAALSH